MILFLIIKNIKMLH